jgi:hypothetical protein
MRGLVRRLGVEEDLLGVSGVGELGIERYLGQDGGS